MNPVTEKVIQRLTYEHLLIAASLNPRRNRITLDQILEAAKEEPRIYQVLPAIILYKPQMVKGLAKDLKRYPYIRDFANSLFATEAQKKKFFGIPIEDCRKGAQTYRKFLESKKTKQKSRTLTLRLSADDKERLRFLASQLGVRSVSETIRLLAIEKEKNLNYHQRLLSFAG